jgi:dihydroxyacetone kinase-like predicted kinase
MYDKSNVEVIETKDIGQAYSILSMLDYSLDDAKEIANQMREDMQGIVTGHVTRSIRDASIDGVDICQGEYIGFSDKTMLTSRSTKIDALLDVADKLGAKQKNFMIISYGETVSESEKTEIAGVIKEKYPTIEFYEINGEQEVYDFIIILE